jgi:hypothetical protein
VVIVLFSKLKICYNLTIKYDKIKNMKEESSGVLRTLEKHTFKRMIKVLEK